MKKDYQKALKKSTSFFLLSLVSFNGQNYQKEKGSGTSHQSLFRSRNKFRKFPLFVLYYLTKFDDVMLSSFWVIPKITSATLCKPIYDIINYSTSICPFRCRTCGKQGERLQKFEYLENKESFLDEIIKKIIVFQGLWFGKKIKIWQKIADTSYKSCMGQKATKILDTILEECACNLYWSNNLTKVEVALLKNVYDGP